MSNALDFNIPGSSDLGTPALASANGTITSARFNGNYGNEVVIDHGDGWSSRVAHLDSFMVRVGQQVVRGQEIGKVGKTGNPTGPHIHYEQIADNARQRIVLHGEELVYSSTARDIVSHNCGLSPGLPTFRTRGSGVRVRKEATTDSEVVHTLSGPTTVEVKCQVHGQEITAEGITNDAWSYLPAYGGYLTNIYIADPAAWLPGVPTCGQTTDQEPEIRMERYP